MMGSIKVGWLTMCWLCMAMAGGCKSAPAEPLQALPTPELVAPVSSAVTPQPSSPRPARHWQRGEASEPQAAANSRRWAHTGYRPWRYIVVHHSGGPAGNAEQFDRDHRARGFDELGYHFVIANGDGGPDGQVQVGPRWTCQKWGAHAGGSPGNAYNNYGIGICLVGNFSNALPTDKQLAALGELLDYLMGRWGIPPGRVIGHCEVPSAVTECPGRAFLDLLRVPGGVFAEGRGPAAGVKATRNRRTMINEQ